MERKYNEIFKLKELLENAHIPFEWQENWGYDEATLTEMRRIAPDLVERYQICYPVFGEGRKLSAVQGYGMYGSEEDLIEIMGLLTPEESDDVVAGHLTAKNVFERIKKDYYERRISIMKKIMVIDEDTLEMKEMVVEEESSTDEVIDDFADALRAALNCESEEFYQKYRDMKKAEEDFNAIYTPFKERLLSIYKDKPDLPKNIIIGGLKLTHVSPSTRTTIDSKKLKEEEPELVKKYSKTSNVKATIRLEEV